MDFDLEQLHMGLLRNFKRSSSWFFIIGALSIINSGIYWFNLGNIRFVVGLAYTEFIDVILNDLYGSQAMVVAFSVNVIISCFFILCGVLGRYLKGAFYYIGIAFYVIDAIIILLISDYFGFAFHLLALYYLFKGIKILRTLNKVDQQMKNSPVIPTEIIEGNSSLLG